MSWCGNSLTVGEVISNVFTQVTRDSVLSDALLLQSFTKAVERIVPVATTRVVTKVHGVLLTKIYNARCNEFLHTIGQMDCFRRKKAVDVNIALRDKLKSFASEKQSHTQEN